jgi:hypothetical protein
MFKLFSSFIRSSLSRNALIIKAFDILVLKALFRLTHKQFISIYNSQGALLCMLLHTSNTLAGFKPEFPKEDAMTIDQNTQEHEYLQMRFGLN